VGGGAPVVVQSMTMTDTADAAATARQCIELAEAGSEMVRVTVNLPEAAEAVPEIKQRMLDAGITAPLIGDFHYNGHLLLTRYPRCAAALDKYRINPGNVGTGKRRDEQFATICGVARDQAKPVRIGVNGGSLNQELVVSKMQENTDRALGRTSEEIINECMVLSALQSTELALESGLSRDRIIISCKTSRPRDLIAVYRDLSRKTDQPLHLGLTEAGMGTKGLVWSASAMGTQAYIRERMPEWKTQYDGVETMTLAVMGCVVNGPGESRAANIGISLPGTGEAPNCPVFIDGEHATTLRGTYEELALAFRQLVDEYVATKYAPKSNA